MEFFQKKIYLIATYGCVANGGIQIRTNKYAQATLSKAADILFLALTTVDAVSLIAPTAIHTDGVYVAGDMFGVHIKQQYNSKYISYLFNYVYNKELSKYAQGSAIIHLRYADKLEATRRLISCYQIQKNYLLKHMSEKVLFLFRILQHNRPFNRNLALNF